jgi:hypothetical protein
MFASHCPAPPAGWLCVRWLAVPVWHHRQVWRLHYHHPQLRAGRGESAPAWQAALQLQQAPAACLLLATGVHVLYVRCNYNGKAVSACLRTYLPVCWLTASVCLMQMTTFLFANVIASGIKVRCLAIGNTLHAPRDKYSYEYRPSNEGKCARPYALGVPPLLSMLLMAQFSWQSQGTLLRIWVEI